MNCFLIDFPTYEDGRGSLTFIESLNHVPFQVKRIYYLYDISASSSRGGHAHKNLHQILIPISGSFNVQVDDGFTSETYFLNKPYCGLFIGNYIWREITNFSSGSVCLVLASEFYLEEDYIRNYDDFKSLVL